MSIAATTSPEDEPSLNGTLSPIFINLLLFWTSGTSVSVFFFTTRLASPTPLLVAHPTAYCFPLSCPVTSITYGLLQVLGAYPFPIAFLLSFVYSSRDLFSTHSYRLIPTPQKSKHPRISYRRMSFFSFLFQLYTIFPNTYVFIRMSNALPIQSASDSGLLRITPTLAAPAHPVLSC